MSRLTNAPLFILLLLLICSNPLADVVLTDDEEVYYKVVDGKVDPDTFVGWRLFHHACVRCHNVGATGSDIAPNLVEKVKTMSKYEFSIKVLERYAVSVTHSEAVAEDRTAIRNSIIEEIVKSERAKEGEVVMPAWENNPIVKEHIFLIYNYLRARADGVLGEGRPEILR